MAEKAKVTQRVELVCDLESGYMEATWSGQVDRGDRVEGFAPLRLDRDGLLSVSAVFNEAVNACASDELQDKLAKVYGQAADNAARRKRAHRGAQVALSLALSTEEFGPGERLKKIVRALRMGLEGEPEVCTCAKISGKAQDWCKLCGGSGERWS